MSWLRFRRLLVWIAVIAVTTIYWVEIAPYLQTPRAYGAAFMIFVWVFFGTLWAVVHTLRLPIPKRRNDVR